MRGVWGALGSGGRGVGGAAKGEGGRAGIRVAGLSGERRATNRDNNFQQLPE